MAYVFGVMVLAGIVALAGLVLLRQPKLLIPAVVLGLPLEVFETEALGALGETGVQGAIRSLLNPGQAAMVLTVIVGLVRLRHRPASLYTNSRVYIPVLLMVALLVLGVAWSDSLVPHKSVLILPLYVGFIIVAPTLIEDRRDMERILGAFLLAAIALSCLALAQRLLAVFQWRGVLIQSDAYSYRSNGTFADPNILARFLAIAVALAAALILTTGPRRLTVYLAAPAIALGLPAIVMTASRSGWLVLLFCGFLAVMVSPIRRYQKAMLAGGSAAVVGVLLAIVLAQGGTDAERVKSFSEAWNLLGQRSFLIEAGWLMFKDNPLVGVGSGNYDRSLVAIYQDVVPYWARATTQSHTALVSLVAELGLVGLIGFTFAFVRVLVVVVRSYFADENHYHRTVVGWLGAALLTVFLHSQSEGRFLEEPYFWVFIAVFAASDARRVMVAAPGVRPPPAQAGDPIGPKARPGPAPARRALRAEGGRV